MKDLRYEGGNPADALLFFKSHRGQLRALRRVAVAPEGTTVVDINGETMFLAGLKLGCAELEALLKLAGASYNPAALHDVPASARWTKEFQVVKSDPWGHDRVM